MGIERIAVMMAVVTPESGPMVTIPGPTRGP